MKTFAFLSCGTVVLLFGTTVFEGALAGLLIFTGFLVGLFGEKP